MTTFKEYLESLDEKFGSNYSFFFNDLTDKEIEKFERDYYLRIEEIDEFHFNWLSRFEDYIEKIHDGRWEVPIHWLSERQWDDQNNLYELKARIKEEEEDRFCESIKEHLSKN